MNRKLILNFESDLTSSSLQFCRFLLDFITDLLHLEERKQKECVTVLIGLYQIQEQWWSLMSQNRFPRMTRNEPAMKRHIQPGHKCSRSFVRDCRQITIETAIHSQLTSCNDRRNDYVMEFSQKEVISQCISH